MSVVDQANIQKVVADGVVCTDGRFFAVDEILWCTAAVGPNWAKEAGFTLDTKGFVLTNDYLQSVSHPFVFATGDIGTQQTTPSEKAGVFAVRQAPILFQNLRRYILQEPLKVFRPQSDFLSLMATGGQRAIASRGPLVVEADWVWRWKDYIDQSFMDKFSNLPNKMLNPGLNRLPNRLLNQQEDALLASSMRCNGCGSKVPSQVLNHTLERVLGSILADDSKEVSPAKDAAVLELPAGKLIQSVDQISALFDDPYTFSRIAAVHALSDVVTLDATPHSAQVIVTLPHANSQLLERDLELVMLGIHDALSEHDCHIVGGHSSQGNELSIGLVVNAVLQQKAAHQQIEVEEVEGDYELILTKALGTGILFRGLMQHQTKGQDIKAAIKQMVMSNLPAAQILRHYHAVAMTDITGFGLLGHTQELIQGFNPHRGVLISGNGVPVLPGAYELAEQGIRSTLGHSNSQLFSNVRNQSNVDKSCQSILCDPQTSGGLLALVPKSEIQACINTLHKSGYPSSASIGYLSGSPGIIVG